MRRRFGYLVVLLVLEWLFVRGLWQGYRWFAEKPFALPDRVGPVPLLHLFLLLVASLVVFLWLYIARQPVGWLGWEKPSQRGVKEGLLLLAFVFPVPLLARVLLPDYDAWYWDRINVVAPAALVVFLVGLVLAVTKEEMLERLMQRILWDVYGPVAAAVIIALQFGLAHTFFSPLVYGLASGVSVALVGFVLGLLFIRTKNWWLTLGFHLAFNVVVFSQIWLHVHRDIVGEILLWAVWGAAWLIWFHPAWTVLRSTWKPGFRGLRLIDWAALAFVGLAVPVALLLL